MSTDAVSSWCLRKLSGQMTGALETGEPAADDYHRSRLLTRALVGDHRPPLYVLGTGEQRPEFHRQPRLASAGPQLPTQHGRQPRDPAVAQQQEGDRIRSDDTVGPFARRADDRSAVIDGHAVARSAAHPQLEADV